MADDDHSAITASEAKLLFADWKAAPAIVLAVSGGPDSIALMWLAARWRRALMRGPRLIAITVDHGLRPEAAREARNVKKLATQLDLPHRTLRWNGAKPKTGVPAAARAARYRLLARAAKAGGATHILTAHTRDDQAETLLMRLARGAGLSGLAATRRRRPLEPGVMLVRPVLNWRRSELAAIVEAAGLTPVDDPTNRDPAHDRTRFRGLLADADWADPERLASSAGWLADADEAIEWALSGLVATRLTADAAGIAIDPASLPRELQRRLLLVAFDRLGASRPRGPDLDRALNALTSGKAATLSGLKLVGGETWRLAKEGTRRR